MTQVDKTTDYINAVFVNVSDRGCFKSIEQDSFSLFKKRIKFFGIILSVSSCQNKTVIESSGLILT
jgi:hypothetical protein